MRWLVFTFAAMVMFCSASAESGETASACSRAVTAEQAPPAEPRDVGVGIVLDEHLLTDGPRDQDYNGGGEVTLSGQHRGPPAWLDQALGSIDRITCPSSHFVRAEWASTHAFAAGLLVFTPRDLAAHGVVAGDRPYASEFFSSVGRRYTATDADVAYDSSLTVGVLGLAAAAGVQRAIHHITGSKQPQGWSHQISSGGEPTAAIAGLAKLFWANMGAAPGEVTASGPWPAGRTAVASRSAAGGGGAGQGSGVQRVSSGTIS